MRPDLERLLGVSVYRAFDTDHEAGPWPAATRAAPCSSSRSPRTAPRQALTALPGACTGRYVPGERAVIVSHDDGGNERHQLSLLPLDARRPEPARGPGRPGAAGPRPGAHPRAGRRHAGPDPAPAPPWSTPPAPMTTWPTRTNAPPGANRRRPVRPSVRRVGRQSMPCVKPGPLGK